MSPTDTELKQAQIADLQASTTRIQADAIATLFKVAQHLGLPLNQVGRGNVIQAVTSNNLNLLITEDPQSTKENA